MTTDIQNKLIELCDNAGGFFEMLSVWETNPEEPDRAINQYLSHVHLNGLLENTKIVQLCLPISENDGLRPAFYFEIPQDPIPYLIIAVQIGDEEFPRCILLHHKSKSNSKFSYSL